MQNFKPKFFTLLNNKISKEQLSKDILSGIVVGVVALPLAIAFAVASGVSPEKGIITAIIAGFIISFLGGSRVQIGGPTGAFIVIVYGIVETYGVSGLIISTILAGIILVIFGLFGLGGLLKYIPHPLIVGFTTAIAIVIFSTQIKDALGLDIEKTPSDFIEKWRIYFDNLHSISPYALGITILTIIIIVVSGKFIKKIPGSFIAIVVITLIVKVFNIPVSTIESFFGDIKGTLSFTIPSLENFNISTYIQPALTIALLGAIESLLSAVVSDGMIGGNHRSNTELIAQGIANIVTPFFGGIPATGAIARTATNVKNGGRTPIAGMVHAVTLLLILLFLGPLAKLIPMACLAGVLIVVSYNMSEWRTFVNILKGPKLDALVLVATFLLTVFIDLTVAIEVGIVLSALIFMKRMADSLKVDYKDSTSDKIENYSSLPSSVTVYEITGPLFFATAKEFIEVLNRTLKDYNTIILRMRNVPFIDATGLHNLNELIKRLNKIGIKIIIADINSEVRSVCSRNLKGEFNLFDSFSDISF